MRKRNDFPKTDLQTSSYRVDASRHSHPISRREVPCPFWRVLVRVARCGTRSGMISTQDFPTELHSSPYTLGLRWVRGKTIAIGLSIDRKLPECI